MFGIRKMKKQIEMLRSQVTTLQHQFATESATMVNVIGVQNTHEECLRYLEKNIKANPKFIGIYHRLEMLERKMVKVKG